MIKFTIVIIILFVLCPLEISATQLPLTIRQQLNKIFYNWKFVLIDKEIHQYFKTRVSRKIRPDLIKGDFDGNGQIDYAVYIMHGKRRTRKASAIAFLKFGSTWKRYILESGSAGDETTPSISYLALGKKGNWYYDYEKNRKYKYPHDAIFFGYFAKGGVSYVHQKGKFRQIVTSD